MIATSRARLTRWVERIDLEQFAPVQFRLVCELAEELAPACIGNGLRESVISQHPRDVQMFYGYCLIFTSKPCRYLVKEIPADICDTFMNASNTDTLSFTIHRLRHLSGKPPLLSAKLALELLQWMWVLYGIAVAIRIECLQPNVNTNLLAIVLAGQGFFFCFDAERKVVFA